MKIDWDAVHERLPIYAYEYEKTNVMEYWHPHQHKGEQPPLGWSAIVREEAHPQLWIKAINEWVAEVLTPNEKAVWFDINTGHFSNTFTLGELQKHAPELIQEKVSNWKLIVYRCETDPAFEFSDMMKIVTKTKEERRRK